MELIRLKKNSGLQRHRTGIARSRNCINCVHCEDHFFIFISFPQFIYDLFHISLTLISLTGTYEPTIDLLPTSVASVGRASHRYREVTGSNPVEVLIFFSASLRNCINCVHCDDHFFIFIYDHNVVHEKHNFRSQQTVCIELTRAKTWHIF